MPRDLKSPEEVASNLEIVHCCCRVSGQAMTFSFRGCMRIVGGGCRESQGPAWCLFFSSIERCIIVDLLMGEDNRMFSLFLIAIFHMVQGDPGCVQELREALCSLPALPWCGRHWLCLLNTDHYCLSCNAVVSGWTKITFCGQQYFLRSMLFLIPHDQWAV